jgi:hypothetical protein
MSELTKAFTAAVIGMVVVIYLGTAARADECSTTTYASFQTSYPYQVTDVQASGKPVLNGGLTRSCGHWWFDAWGSKDFSGKESFGNEVDLTAAYASTIGSFHYEALVSWWLLPDLGKINDDLVQLQLDVSRPFVLSSATITPYLRVTHLVGLGLYHDTDVGKAGIRFAVPLAAHWSLSGDAGVADDFTNDIVAKRLNASIGYDLGDGLSLNAGVKLADRLKPAFVLGISKQF